MQESEQERDLAAWEARLSAFRPAPSRLDRDRVMYLSGRASAGKGPASGAKPAAWAWPTAFSVMTAIAGCLLAVLIVRGPETAPTVATDGTRPTTKTPAHALIQESYDVGASGNRDQNPTVEPERVFWPTTARPATLTATPSPTISMIARLENSRSLRPTPEIDRPVMPLLRSDGPVQPSRPRPYVEHRRVVFEQLIPSRETSAESGHPSNGA